MNFGPALGAVFITLVAVLVYGIVLPMLLAW